MVKNKLLNIAKLKKILQSKGYKISNKNKLISLDLGSIGNTFLVSIFLIIFFYFLPLVLKYSSNFFSDDKIVINSSNKNFHDVPHIKFKGPF